MTTDLDKLANRYVAVWNEPDQTKRRNGIERLWVQDGLHFTPTREVKGYDALEARVEESHSKFVRDQGFIFRVSGEPLGHHGLVKFYWVMVDPKSDTVNAVGSDVVLLDASGCIISDYQFTEPLSRA
ncbi:hypothetical protein [Phyllobacterium myrsinacearum]|uniref:SnoaL-like domain-containing protein n=1 Tax=Phyllobacterium myrsinacearum TaxID=28101 RepID=A0A2S9JGU2_9HYPH|nr:hypothetical protein [Phyllobacterium myrsinacearum]PRD52174.1 hypothetical protein C5750_14760 [Phyllobacterium myrsinacearum]PWV83779.1 hypothetical protein DEV92_12057 [Phyllobacterium myrsinacearum]RZS74125.1 hypothetical protein EV217_5201 [Phyllobacterium myrsinacearum]RZV04700.1 hypothetical protein EV654_3500 [Phyllobacterium myrsinacearum]